MKLNVINRNLLFAGLTESETAQALSLLSATERNHHRGSIIATAGAPMERFGLVISGAIQVSFSDIDGNSVIMANVSEGETFGESLCWLSVAESPVTIAAVADSTVLWLSPKALKENGSDSGIAREMKQRFVSMLARKTLSMNDRIQILSKPTIRQKLITFLSQCSVKNGSKTFSVPFDRESLALYLGVNRSALSRELSNMQKEGIIEYYKNTFKILK